MAPALDTGVPAARSAQRDFTAVTPSGRRLAFLDVLRGLAALSVCFQHALEQTAGFRAFARSWVNFGAFGVVVFFIISGFIIPASVEKYGSLGRFWKGRVLRIFPMYLVVLAATVLLDVALHRPLCGGGRAAVPCVAANLTLLGEFMGFPLIVGVAWTLALELVFYALFSVAFAVGWHRHPGRVTAVAMGGFLLLTAAAWKTHHNVPAGRLGMLVLAFYGFLLYGVYRGQLHKRFLSLGTVALLLVLTPALWLRFHHNVELDSFGEVPFNFRNVCITWYSGVALFLALYALRDRVMPAFLQWLGKVSYSFYLLAGLWASFLISRRLLGVWLALELVIVLSVSALTYRFIERPFMRLGARSTAPPAPRPST